jgi:hypothetical protein
MRDRERERKRERERGDRLDIHYRQKTMLNIHLVPWPSGKI